MKIVIESRKVMEEIYAQSALHGYVSLPDKERALLQEDQSEGLAILVADAFSEIVIELMPRIAGYGMPDNGTDGSMWIELKEGYGDESMLQLAIESMIVNVMVDMVMSAIYDSIGKGSWHECRAERKIALLREVIDGMRCEPRLQGWR